MNDPTTSIRPLMAGYVGSPDYEPSMFVDADQAKDLVDNNTVVVVVDTNKPSYTECEDLLYLTKTIVVLDHHRRGSEVIQNAVLSYVEPYASSTCEMVAEILQYFSDDLQPAEHGGRLLVCRHCDRYQQFYHQSRCTYL